jgi:patatin-like phospholipase/acyl hydrolase
VQTDRFQILSLDGGGIKGLFSAAVLARIEEDLSVDITDHFDLIVGTSTGGIIALGLGLGLRPREIVDFYAQRGSKIFRGWFGARSAGHWLFRKFPQTVLREALQSPDVFGEKKLGDSKKRLVIPSYNIGADDVYLFKTPHYPGLNRDWKVPAWQVALATSAAPTYFPACCYVDHIRHIDGGVWANNPTMIGIVEAISKLDVNLSKISVLNLGTSDPVVGHPKRLNWGGKLLWANCAVDVVMRGQSLGVHKQAKNLVGEERITRLDPKVPYGLFALDTASRKDDLLAMAAQESRGLVPELTKRFLDHKASPYVPLMPQKQGEAN